MRTRLANSGLLLASCAVGFLLCEVSLRIFHPKYRDLADAQFQSDAMRIFARKPNGRRLSHHPDTRLSHPLYHNNFGLRQHRDFRESDLAAAANIGVFGDSFTENIKMAAPYSFTEPLDYLLNLAGEDRFNVLNFGVAGYGTGQSFMHYTSFSGRAWDFDQVLYVYCHNDLRDIYRSGLFHLDEAGRMVQAEAVRERWWVPLVGRLHVTYLILDAIGRVSLIAEQAVSTNEHLRRGFNDRRGGVDDTFLSLTRSFQQGDLTFENQQILEIFRQLIRRWKNSVEDNGGAFSIVLLPDHAPHSYVVDSIRAEGIETIDLYACFNESDPAFSETRWRESSYRFRNDAHWNETGTSLAAVCLYRALEVKMGLPVLSEDRLQEAVSRYYAAFGGEFPLPADFAGEGGSASTPEASAEIRKKYMELDLELESEIRDLVRQPDKRIIASEFDVYLVGDRLVYVKDECRPTDMHYAPFFLHVAPVDDGDLAVLRRPHGFENVDFHENMMMRINDRQCAITVDLPGWPVRGIRTGQYVPGAGEIWSAEFSMGQARQAN